MDIILSILAFVVAILILVTVHEFGHFWVAKKCGVKVLKFSVGFGKSLYTKQIGETEFALSAIPLGGYVKMLDAREEGVPEEDMGREFTHKPLLSRALIVAAGPAFNFIFAIFAYWLVFVSGVTGLNPVVGKVMPESIAAQAQFEAGDRIKSVNGEAVQTWSEMIEELVKAASYDSKVAVQVESANQQEQTLTVDTSGFLKGPEKWLKAFGLTPDLPVVPAVIAQVMPESRAEQALLQAGDKVLAVDGEKIASWQDLVVKIKEKPEQKMQFLVRRASGEEINVEVLPEAQKQKGKTVGKIGVSIAMPSLSHEYQTTVRYGALESVGKAASKTWDISRLTLAMIGKMFTGEVAVKDSVGGPISIAKFAGDSFFAGFASFVGFLALISVSLGVLNLLPIPVLDGGHLFLYLIEFIKGSPVSENVELVMQKIGMILLFSLMFFAMYNDINKLL